MRSPRRGKPAKFDQIEIPKNKIIGGASDNLLLRRLERDFFTRAKIELIVGANARDFVVVGEMVEAQLLVRINETQRLTRRDHYHVSFSGSESSAADHPLVPPDKSFSSWELAFFYRLLHVDIKIVSSGGKGTQVALMHTSSITEPIEHGAPFKLANGDVVLPISFPILAGVQAAGQRVTIQAILTGSPWPADSESLHEQVAELLNPHYSESAAPVRCVEKRGVDVVAPVLVHAGDHPLHLGTLSYLVVHVENTGHDDVEVTNLKLDVGSTRYLGTNGSEPVDCDALFNVSFETAAELPINLSAGGRHDVIVRITPKPAAYLQYSEKRGSFCAPVAFSWKADFLSTEIISRADVIWHGPKSSDITVNCQCDTAKQHEAFDLQFSVNNMSERARTLSLSMGNFGPSLFCAQRVTYLGSVPARTKRSVNVQLIGLRPGLYTLDQVTVIDVSDEGGEEIPLRVVDPIQVLVV